MAPEAKGEDLLYVSDGNGAVFVFAYPSGKFVGQLSGGFRSPNGLCSDRFGDVFVTDWQYQRVLEFAHGGTSPIKTFWYYNWAPADCSVDPVTGNLAVANLDSYAVFIYSKAQGNPQIYVAPGIVLDCAYDGQGNLFAGLFRARLRNPPKVAELPRGSSQFRTIKLSRAIFYAEAIRWDGSLMAINDGKNVYRVRFSGSKATIVGVTPMYGSKFIYAIWIQGRTLIGADINGADVGFWAYPAGGPMLKEIIGLFSSPSGVTVSVSP
jgi:hypothetical protein